MRSLSLAVASLALTLTAVPSAVADAVGEIDLVLALDPAVGEFPEGVAVDKQGNIFVSVAPTGEVKKIDKHGAVSSHAAFNPGVGFVLGLTTDKHNNLYVALASFDPATEGVHRVTPQGAVTRVAHIAGFPNDLVFDGSGKHLYVTESIGGAVHRIEIASGAVEPWFVSPLLAGDLEVSPVPFPIGANGIAFDRDSLIVANSQQPRLVRVPIAKNGSAGAPEIILEDPILAGADGIALDVKRDIYVGVNQQHLLVKVSPDGSDIDILADASDGLDFPSTVAFGRGPAGKKDLYIVNFALFSGPTASPGLLRLDVGVPGSATP